MEIEERFWSKVEVGAETECWPWTGTLTTSGYAQFSIRSANLQGHRLAYELEVGEIPPGALLDHVCHDPGLCAGGTSCPHRRCVNPNHLKISTVAENNSARRRIHRNSRKTHCPRGHPYAGDNLVIEPGGRKCRTCISTRGARRSDGE